MKRRIATLLTLALSATLLLGGCGGSSDTETTNNDSNNSSGGFLSEVKSSKTSTLSECLSSEKVIGYEVDSVDKAETPDNIYFFENGKVTIVPGYAFDLTMGDYSKMSDEEIWSKYETVWEDYSLKYKNEKLESTDLGSDIQEVKADLNYVSEFKTSFDEGLMSEYYIEVLAEIQGDGELFETLIMKYRDFELENQKEATTTDVFTEEQIATLNTYFETKIEKYTTELESLQEQLDLDICKGPFKEMPISFVVETDSSGNEVMSESLLYPSLEYYLTDKMPSPYYDSLDFVLGLTRQETIYDTSYNCIALEGSGGFLTREVMDIDSLDSKNILIDLSSDEKNELFKDEIMSRYE